MIPEGATKVHGISTAKAKRFGVRLENAVYTFRDMLDAADVLVAHNGTYDAQIIGHAFHTTGLDTAVLGGKQHFCTMRASTGLVKAPHKSGTGGYKWPTLTECIAFFFGETLVGSHDAMVDVRACGRIYRHLMEMQMMEKLAA